MEALKELCNYGATDATLAPLLGAGSVGVSGDPVHAQKGSAAAASSTMRELFAAKGRAPTLHEVMMAEKADFQTKVERANRRKQWLRANQVSAEFPSCLCVFRIENVVG